MTINMTLVVQGINFCIAYMLLRRFLLKPVVRSIHHEQAQEAALHSAIESRKASIREQEYEMHNRWRIFQNSYASKMPHVQDERVFRYIKPQVQVQVPSQEALMAITTDVTAASVQKVRNVRW
jgi:hypothetical protein